MTIGTNTDDTLLATVAGDILTGKRGDDVLRSTLDDTTLWGDAGDDTLETDLPAFPDRNYDIIRHSAQYGGTGNDTLNYTHRFSFLSYDTFKSIQSGGVGDDTIYGFATQLWSLGGAGNDLITQATYAEEGQPFIHIDGGTGADTIMAHLDGSDVVLGLADISGAGGADVITLDGRINSTDASIYGGTGADTIEVDLSGKDTGRIDVNVDAGGGADVVQVYSRTSDNATSALNLMGGAGSDRITAQVFANWAQCLLDGGNGHDTLICTPETPDGLGEATLLGGSGHDQLIANFKPEGITLRRFNDIEVRLLLDGGSGHDLIEATIGQYDESLSSPWAIFEAQSRAFGGLGHDTILISGGHDNLIDGGGGHDSLRGSENADLIIGGLGADTLHGQAGDDTLTGGAGRDTFVFAQGDLGTTIVTDWNWRQDRLDLGFIETKDNYLLDDLKANSTYVLIGTDGYLTLETDGLIIFKDVTADNLEDLFLDPASQII